MLKETQKILGRKKTFAIDDLNERIVQLDKTNVEMAGGARSRSGGPAMSGANASAQLVTLFQTKLVALGLLDPIIEGSQSQPFGPVAKVTGIIDMDTRNALCEFSKLANVPFDDYALTGTQLEKLESSTPDTFLPVQFENVPGDDAPTLLAKRLLRAMRSRGYWIARSPDMYNIVYVEGMNSDGLLNPDAPNEWNDRRFVINIGKGGKPRLLVNDQATTEPGRYYTVEKPLNAKGAARIAFGQYKAWMRGKHQGWQPALVQRGLLRVHRDGNKNFKRDSADFIDIGDTFGVNQHSTAEGQLPILVGKYSAGCLVGRNYDAHLAFLALLEKDVRYQLNNGYMYMSAVLAGDKL